MSVKNIDRAVIDPALADRRQEAEMTASRHRDERRIDARKNVFFRPRAKLLDDIAVVW